MFRMRKSILVFLLSVLISKSYGGRILAVIPTASISHQVVFRPLTQELARRGHEVTIITPNPAFTTEDSPENLTEIDVHDVTYTYLKPSLEKLNERFGSRETIFNVIEGLSTMMGKFVEIQVQSEPVQTLINNTDKDYFDLLLIEACGRQYISFSHLFNAPVVLGSSFGMMLGNAEIIGAPNHPFLYPPSMRQRLLNLTFWDKVSELYTHYRLMNFWYSQETKEREVYVKYFGEDIPTYDELYNKVDMLFLNIHPLWSNRQPLPPNVVSMWGIHKNPEKPLPKELQSYLDSSKNGVVYLSFGSNARSSQLPKETIQIFLNVFAKLPYEVLWKWETNDLPGKTDNVKTAQWLPQSDLLRHPNIKLFITQGGLQSTDEAITAGVPLVGIPMLGDQWYNVELYEYHKIGQALYMETITEEKLLQAIHTVIDNISYKENIIKLRELLNDQPESPLERSVWWIEYVLRHGGAKHLRAPNANMPMYEFYEIEFLLKLTALVLLSCVVIIATLYYMYLGLTLGLRKQKLKSC
ncbi:unnamed protein product [Pieris macdunnoughi]|uniref:UDP-glucuronosyltransferase n=1 Tax=Pieris macdunnoughi TaxID=345717 RepID=A0A821XF81_9NEOP|nr:unnamed protein product [Pieris macdunnoughi]